MFSKSVLELAEQHQLELVFTPEVLVCGIDLKRGIIYVNGDYMESNPSIADSSLLHEIGHYIDAESYLSVGFWYAQYTSNLTNMIKSEQRANNIAIKLGKELGVDINLEFFKENIRGYVLKGQKKLEKMAG